MPVVLVDATVLSNFAHLQRDDLLQQAFADLAVPDAVMQEIHDGEQLGRLPVRAWDWLQRLTLTEAEAIQAQILNQQLGAGESECIAAAAARDGVVLTDDQDARRITRSLDVSISGTLGVLVALIDAGHLTLSEADRMLAEMVEHGYRSPVTSLSELES